MSQKIPKNPISYSCEKCKYNTVNKKDFSKHLSTRKHHIRTNENILEQQYPQKIETYICNNCNKVYKARSGLWNHKKSCSKNTSQLVEKKEVINNELIIALINDNKELKKIIIDQNKTIHELIPKLGNTTNNTNNINIVMNNINFLNKQCKNALSLSDFINSISIEVEDLEFTGKKGFIEGLSNIFLENYNKLPLQLRPLWCGDKKRKKMYVKENEWTEDKDNKKTKEAFKDLTVKQAKNTNKFSKKHPDWMNNDKKKNEYISIIGQTTADVNDKLEKIISSIANETYLSDGTKDHLQTSLE
jgi:hypothetical protein